MRNMSDWSCGAKKEMGEERRGQATTTSVTYPQSPLPWWRFFLQPPISKTARRG